MEVFLQKWILIIVLLIDISGFSTIYAQTDQQNDTIGKSYVTINLLAPLDVYLPRWRMGYIKKIDNKWKIGLDIGYGNHDITLSGFRNYIEEQYRIGEIRPQFYYILNPERKAENYVSVELFYVNHKDVFDGGDYFSENGSFQQYDSANFRRQKYGINLIHGFLFYSKWRIGVNGYIGIGLKIRNKTFSDVINPKEMDPGIEGGDMAGIMDYRRVEGIKVGVNPVLGIKLYYKFYN